MALRRTEKQFPEHTFESWAGLKCRMDAAFPNSSSRLSAGASELPAISAIFCVIFELDLNLCFSMT
jgi:hypothetical protein